MELHFVITQFMQLWLIFSKYLHAYGTQCVKNDWVDSRIVFCS